MTNDTDTRPAQIITADTPFWELPGFDHMAPESEDDAMPLPEHVTTDLLKPFPPSLIETKDGRSYIGHEHVRMRIIEATQNRFDWIVTSEEFRQDGVNNVITNKRTGENYTPIVHRVSGVLTIPGLGSRHGTGVQTLVQGAGEDTYKAAESDAFKRAAMAFGVGLHLYMSTPTPARAPQPRSATIPDDAYDDAPPPRGDIVEEQARQRSFSANPPTEKQIGMMNGLLSKVYGTGWEKDDARIEDMRQWLHSITGCTSRTQLTKSTISTYIDWLKDQPAAEA